MIPTVAIRVICNNYSARYWTIDRRDMEHEAVAAALEAERTWRPDGAPLDCYQARAAALAVRRYCARAACPVSGCSRAPATAWSFTAVPLWEQHPGADAPDSHYWRRQLAAEIRRILYGLPDGHLAKLVLLDEYKPAEVARQERCKLRRVYRATSRAYQALAESETLQSYAAEAA